MIVFTIVSLLTINGIHSLLNPAIPRDHDIAYIARNCVGISTTQAQNISEHIDYDPSIGGSWYIFEERPGAPSPGGFEAAWRPWIEEIFCFPVFGCAVPLSLRKGCLENYP